MDYKIDSIYTDGERDYIGHRLGKIELHLFPCNEYGWTKFDLTNGAEPSELIQVELPNSTYKIKEGHIINDINNACIEDGVCGIRDYLSERGFKEVGACTDDNMLFSNGEIIVKPIYRTYNHKYSDGYYTELKVEIYNSKMEKYIEL